MGTLMTEILLETTTDRLHVIVAVLAWLGLVTYIAQKNGFYSLPESSKTTMRYLFFRDVMGVFSFFLLVQIVIVPFVARELMVWIDGSTEAVKLTTIQQGWINVCGILASAGIIVLFCKVLEPRTAPIVLGASKKTFSSNLGFGILTWIIAYPAVVLVNQTFAIIGHYFEPSAPVDQVAVKYLKLTFQDPSLYWVTVVMITFIVPCIEETLFRGFLQTWLVQRYGLLKGILSASTIFTIFHFSSSQGWHNIELLTSLFLLSCYLGFIYVKRSSLWSSIGLHMTFNAVSILLISLSEGS